MTRRRWIADDWDETSASLRGEQAAHLIRVLRAQTGMECDMVAGDRVWRAVISGVSGDAVRFTLLSEVVAEPALPVTLLLSVFKFDRMEWIIEKATELGAERFIPMTARRSEKHLVQAAGGARGALAAGGARGSKAVAPIGCAGDRRSGVVEGGSAHQACSAGIKSAACRAGAFDHLVCSDAIALQHPLWKSRQFTSQWDRREDGRRKKKLSSYRKAGSR